MLPKPEGNVLMKKAIHDSNIPKYDEKMNFVQSIEPVI